jgi:hypothetical protein
MAKKGLTTEKVQERERVAYGMFQKAVEGEKDLGAKAVLQALKSKHKFGMRMGRLYELKRLAKNGQPYTPKERKGKGGATTPARALDMAARRGQKVAAPGTHPAITAATKLLEEAGFRGITINAYMPVHYEQVNESART